MESGSPPRKKLKQARLPFQILGHKDSTAESASGSTSRKRHLSEESKEDVSLSKVVKKSEEYKENDTAVAPVQVNNVKSGESDVEDKSLPSDPSKSVQADQESGTQDNGGGFLQSQMKSKFSKFFEKKPFDFSADVGSCDCGCEDANSEDEALREYVDLCGEGKLANGSSSGKKANGKPKKTRKSKDKSDLKSPSHKAGKRHDTKAKVVDKDVSESPCSSKAEEPVSKTNEETIESAGKSTTPEKGGLLSKKATDLFAKWRKGVNDNLTSTGSLVGKEETANECNLKETLNEAKVKRETVLYHEDKVIKSGEEDLDASEDVKIETDLPISSCLSSKDTKVEIKKEESDGAEKLKSDDGESFRSNFKSEVKADVLTAQKSLSDSPSTMFKISKTEIMETPDSPGLTDQNKSLCPSTPTGVNKTPQRRLTPKQLERQKEVAKRQEEKEKQRLERELEKKRLKDEKNEQKRKEKEEKDELRRKEKEEKEKKKQAEQEQKNEEKKKKEHLKAEDKRRKEEEKRKLDEEKKKVEEEEERRKAKASAMFTSFFVPKSTKSGRDDVPELPVKVQNFMPFEVKADMRMAPKFRVKLSSPEKINLDNALRGNSSCSRPDLYLESLKSGKSIPKVGSRTWPIDETKEEDDDVCVLEPDDGGALISNNKKIEKMRAKFLQFHENHRPAYRGTWRKRSATVTGRRPFGQEKVLDYEVDSADEWEEEEPGESLHGSDDEKEKESEDEYEVDNNIFVPHGYLSDDEGDDENEEVLSPETQKAKLKLLGEEFEAQMKCKTSTLKPIIIVLTAALQASSFNSIRYQKLYERRAVWQEDEGPIALSQIQNDHDNAEGQMLLSSETSCVSSGPGAKKKNISEEAIPALITLIHGNQNKRLFLTNEFSAFLEKSGAMPNEDVGENPSSTAGVSENSDLPSRPDTPSTSSQNPLLMKWPGLPRASRISISNKIKELASWGQCPEEGPMLNRQCWYVAEDIRLKYGLSDLKLPNAVWHYTLKPKILRHGASPIAPLNPTMTNSPDSRALITKFTKIMTPEEKQKQWESLKSTPGTPSTSSSKLKSTKGSSGKITAFTTQVRTPGSTQQSEGSKTNTPASSQPQAKKRVPILASVPRGQQITSSSHCSLLSKFEASQSVSSTSTSQSNVDNPIVLD